MKIMAWVQAFRLKFLPQGVAPVIIGSAIAYRDMGVFFLDLFLITFFGMMLVQFALTMLDDWHDYVRGTDTTPISPGEMINVVALFYVASALIGLYLTHLKGPTVLYIMVAGLFISLSYSLWPFQFAYRGLGELMMLLGYGPTITLGAYYVQAVELTFQAFLAGLVPGMLMWAMIIVNEIPDTKRPAKKISLCGLVERKE
jgi:1,4-dihydroxy-2-naphthoate octaprenyltransferase